MTGGFRMRIFGGFHMRILGGGGGGLSQKNLVHCTLKLEIKQKIFMYVLTL